MWLISAECPELINAIPLAIRDEKNSEDVAKTDAMADDVLDEVRYGMKSMLSPNEKPKLAVLNDMLREISDMNEKAMAHRIFEKNYRPTGTSFSLKRRHR